MRLLLLIFSMVCLTLAGCGPDAADTASQTPPVRPELTLADQSSSLEFRFKARPDVQVARLENAVVTLPEGAQPADVTFRLDLWVDRGVPNVAASHVVQKNGGHFRQLAQLRNVAIEGRVDDKIVWHPKMRPLTERPSLGTKIEGAEPPSDDADDRLQQMQTLINRFSMPGTAVQSDPVYRYESSGYGVIDGGVFVFSDGAVKAILVIEAYKSLNQNGWQYRVNRMTSPPGSITLDGEDIRSWDGFWTSPRTKADEYVEQKIESGAGDE